MPNLASRLCGEATAGQILVGQRVFMSVEHEVEAAPVGDFVLESLHRPVPASEVVRLRGGGGDATPAVEVSVGTES